MAKKKDKQEESADSTLVSAAKTLGEAAGKIAAVVGIAKKSTKVPKLAKKKKSRLPRKEKKALQKAARKK